ncbi:MAG: NAD-dependent epimerase/dehydratase family protein [Actinomycetota bacterium]|nr:NAD-dependent epimerase/dehydratase family protein [Actinomycetota bacterium]MDQ3644699.1 NAD-dependent epimerase/dehydratase family protein [Actinomycetota bacterium]
MRIVVVGATGNVGTSLLRALGQDPDVDEVIGVARRVPSLVLPKTTWVQADVVHSDLTPIFRGADAVIHLAWLIQPSRDEATTRATNVEGSSRVFAAVGSAEVPTLVYASSVGTYSPGPKDRRVDESWPTDGIETSYYSRHKAEVERRLDRFEREHPGRRVVRLRPGLIFKGDAASGIRRLFAGPFLPNPLLRRELIPVLPVTERLIFQAVHAHDVGEAYRLATMSQTARGAYNIAAEPVLDPARLGRLLGARPVKVPRGALRRAAEVSWRLRLQPTDASWLDLGLDTPLMDTTRAREELGWRAQRSSEDALAELIEGMRQGTGFDTPPLARRTGGPLRIREITSGIGARIGLTKG